MTWFNKVMWTEGMFLQPQHFQQQERHLGRQHQAGLAALCPWPWGFLALQVDETLLLQGKVALLRARGLLPDGTSFCIPEDEAAPPALEIPSDARDEVVMLAVALARPGVAESDVEVGEARPRCRSAGCSCAWCWRATPTRA
jgi:type VI secretion system protein ImpJ